jgi:hypothetical protein
MTAQVARLPGGRLHLNHGPIDIVLKAWGASDEVTRAYEQAARRFATILDELVGELALLRQPVGPAHPLVHGAVARRMAAATAPFAERFITPMAAVAGSVADEVMAALTAGRDLTRAYVNNGGDIALYLTPGEVLKAGIVDDQDAPALNADVEVSADMPVRGLATSGWRGRSLSLGIADAVTVLARDAATADAAATLIANAVDVDDPAVVKRPAASLRDDTDLGERLVTVAVGDLPESAIVSSMNAGVAVAKEFRARGLIDSAYLALQNRRRVVARNTSTFLAGVHA